MIFIYTIYSDARGQLDPFKNSLIINELQFSQSFLGPYEHLILKDDQKFLILIATKKKEQTKKNQ